MRLAGLVVLVVIAAAVVGAGSGQSRPAASILVDGTTDTVTNVDPAGNYDYGSGTVDLLIYQHLLGFPEHAKKPTPELATGCKANGAQTVWTCTLKSGQKFSNGDPVTANDVKWSFDRVNKIKDPSGIYSLLSNMASVSTSGADKVVFHMKSPDSTWPFILTTGAAQIVDSKTYPADKIVANTDVKDLVGSGPYVLDKYTPGQSAVFKPNPNYSGAVKNDGLIINYYSKSSTMKLALQKGEIDMAFRDFTPTEYASLAKTNGLKVWKGNGVVIRYLVLNVKRKPTNSLAVRKALAYLIPRTDIASRVYHGSVTPLYSMVPAGLPGHTEDFAEMYGNAPSPSKAKAVLKAAGVKMPVPITIWWTPSHYGDASADEYSEIQRALNSSGAFKVTLKSAEWATYSKTLGTQYNAFQLGWFPDYPDAEDYIVPFYGSKSDFTSNGYANKKMDALIKKEEAAKTTAQRLSFIVQAQKIAAQDVPYIPYWQGAMQAVSKTNVSGIQATLDPTYLMRFWLVSKS